MSELFYSPQSIVFFIFIIIFSSMIGSFINVCAYRLPLGRSIVAPASACTSCGENIKWFFNIPVLGYLFLRGRCDCCFSPFSYRYALVELITALFGLIVYLKFAANLLECAYYFLFMFFLLVIFLTDLDHWLILDSISIPAIVIGLLGSLFFLNSNPYDSIFYFFFPDLPVYSNKLLFGFINSMSGLACGYFIFTMIAFLGSVFMRQEAMGGGDIKLAMLMGAFLGLGNSLFAFMLSFFLGFIFIMPMLVFMNKGGREPLPFGTFMALSAFITLVWGDLIINKIVGF